MYIASDCSYFSSLFHLLVSFASIGNVFINFIECWRDSTLFETIDRRKSRIAELFMQQINDIEMRKINTCRRNRLCRSRIHIIHSIAGEERGRGRGREDDREWKGNIVIGSRFSTWLISISEQIYQRIPTRHWFVFVFVPMLSSHSERCSVILRATKHKIPGGEEIPWIT